MGTCGLNFSVFGLTHNPGLFTVDRDFAKKSRERTNFSTSAYLQQPSFACQGQTSSEKETKTTGTAGCPTHLCLKPRFTNDATDAVHAAACAMGSVYLLILQDTTRYYKILQNTTRYYKILQDITAAEDRKLARLHLMITSEFWLSPTILTNADDNLPRSSSVWFGTRKPKTQKKLVSVILTHRFIPSEWSDWLAYLTVTNGPAHLRVPPARGGWSLLLGSFEGFPALAWTLITNLNKPVWIQLGNFFFPVIPLVVS